MQDAVQERVRVGIVGRPAADVDVGVRLVLGELEVLGHRLCWRGGCGTRSRETLRRARGRTAANSPKKIGMDRGRELDRSRATRVASTELSGEAVGPRSRGRRSARPPSSRGGPAGSGRGPGSPGGRASGGRARRRRSPRKSAAPQLQVCAAVRGVRLKTTKYVVRRGLSRYPEAKRGSCRKASASAGRRSRASESRPARNSSRISSGEIAEVEDDALAAGTARAPVVGVALELQPAARLEADDPEGPRSDGALARRSSRSRRCPRGRSPSRRRKSIGREEGDRLFEVHVELRRRHDVEALRDPSPRPSSRRWAPWIGESTQRLSLSRFSRSRSQEWRTSRAVSRRPS